MECKDVARTPDRTDFLIFATVYTLLAVVLMVSLAVGGREVVAGSPGQEIDRVSITSAP
jgi:hypothetical protein